VGIECLPLSLLWQVAFNKGEGEEEETMITFVLALSAFTVGCVVGFMFRETV